MGANTPKSLSAPPHTPNKKPSELLGCRRQRRPLLPPAARDRGVSPSLREADGDRRPPGPPASFLQLFTWVPAAVSGVSGAQHRAHCPGAWCGEAGRSPRQLRPAGRLLIRGLGPGPGPRRSVGQFVPLQAFLAPGAAAPLPPPSPRGSGGRPHGGREPASRWAPPSRPPSPGKLFPVALGLSFCGAPWPV